MRRKIELYINGTLADLGDQSFVLFNWAQTELTKPSVVKNSFSKQITLPGTPANNAIFGGYSRPDRVTPAGGFSALQKTPFVLYDETSSIVESGYLRLDSASRVGDICTGYKVTLFGSLGSFFYDLSYTTAGDKMTLADLDYLGTGTPASELDFDIDTTNVGMAWARLGSTALTSIWDVINFAPAYEGYPDGNFSADKAYGNAYTLYLATLIPSGTHADSGNGVRINLPAKVTGWQAHDLRSYLQRPVLSVRAFLAACVRKAAECGYILDISQIPSADVADLWKTLPLIWNSVNKTADTPVSGTTIHKADILTSKHSPADYLISLARQFGWYFLRDASGKTITILSRNDFFNTGLAGIDLTDRIDRGKAITVTPMNVAAKWYDFLLEVAPSNYAEEYENKYGVRYGVQRVNTGYSFDDSDVNLLDGSALRGAVTKLAGGWTWYERSAQLGNIQFLQAGCTFTVLKDGDNSEQNVDIPAREPSSLTPYNPSFPGYDVGPSRLDFEGADGKAVDGDDVLCWYTGSKTMVDVALSDDSAAMLAANGGKPCWYFSGGGTTTVPTFSRYKMGGLNYADVQSSLDMGTPREASFPDVHFSASSSGYYKYWQLYIADLLDIDTKVMKCRVRLDGLQVNQSLLRRFFWYGNAWWVLNKISNHSLTTFDTTECEFVQVKDKANYTNGQR